MINLTTKYTLTPSDVNKVFDTCSKRSVVVLGDLAVDHIIHCKNKTVSPDNNTTPMYESWKHEIQPGCASNVAQRASELYNYVLVPVIDEAKIPHHLKFFDESGEHIFRCSDFDIPFGIETLNICFGDYFTGQFASNVEIDNLTYDINKSMISEWLSCRMTSEFDGIIFSEYNEFNNGVLDMNGVHLGLIDYICGQLSSDKNAVSNVRNPLTRPMPCMSIVNSYCAASGTNLIVTSGSGWIIYRPLLDSEDRFLITPPVIDCNHFMTIGAGDTLTAAYFAASNVLNIKESIEFAALATASFIYGNKDGMMSSINKDIMIEVLEKGVFE